MKRPDGGALWGLRRFRDQGIRVGRVVSGTGSAFRPRRFARTLPLLDIRHISTRPYPPKAGGEAERRIQTLPRDSLRTRPSDRDSQRRRPLAMA